VDVATGDVTTIAGGADATFTNPIWTRDGSAILALGERFPRSGYRTGIWRFAADGSDADAGGGTDLLAGSITAATTKTAAAPLERVKLLMQTQAANRDLVVPYRHTWDCVVRVAREQGWRSFWRGNVASVLRYFPQQAFTFATKDTFQRWFSSPAHRTWWHRALANLAAAARAPTASGALLGGATALPPAGLITGFSKPSSQEESAVNAGATGQFFSNGSVRR
jgi:hypothetical protein